MGFKRLWEVTKFSIFNPGQQLNLQSICRKSHDSATPVSKDTNGDFQVVHFAECAENSDTSEENMNCIVKTLECVDDQGNPLSEDSCEKRHCYEWDITGDDFVFLEICCFI